MQTYKGGSVEQALRIQLSNSPNISMTIKHKLHRRIPEFPDIKVYQHDMYLRLPAHVMSL